MRLIIFYCIFLAGILSESFSQNISGTIKDAVTGEAVIGANIIIKGTLKGTSSDVNGKYSIKSVAPGDYYLVASSVSYKTKITQLIKVESNKDIVVNIDLEEDITELSGAVVVGMKRRDTDVEMIKYMKINEFVVSGISAEQIAKSQDRDAAQVVRRIPGVTLIEDRFIIVRGLNSRYNTVLVNGIMAPSTESESKAFSFDIIPSSLLDRIMVYKSGAAELPGEFGGSVVTIQTKNALDKNFTSFSFNVGYQQNTTFNKFQVQQSEKLDWTTFGDRNRNLPANAPSDYKDQNFDFNQIVLESKKFRNNWALKSISAEPDLRGRLDLGRVFTIGNMKVNTINSLSYSNTNKGTVQQRNRYYNYQEDGSSIVEFDYRDNQFSNSVRIGALSNWLFQINNMNRIEFKNLYTRLGKSETTIRNGIDEFKAQDVRNYSMRYSTRSIYLSQLQGTHYFNDQTDKLVWLFGISTSASSEPDWRRISTRKNKGIEGPYQVNIPSNANASDASRFYQNVNEANFSHRVDFEKSISNFKNLEPIIIRTGYFAEYKQRHFAARTIGYIKFGNQFDPKIGTQPFDRMFNTENIKVPDGLVISENTKYTDKYSASGLLTAGYIGGTMPLSERIKFTPGIRFEYDNLNLETGLSPGGLPDQLENKVISILPSTTISIELSPKSKVRLSYSKSVNRPEFRELAPFSFYDFSFEVDIMGNPNLKVADINNFDLRLEFYPTPVELLSVGVFYKRFENPIEAEIKEGTSKPVFIFNNANNANAYGIEAEIRKEMDDLIENDFFSNFSVMFNGSYIISEIDLGSDPALANVRVRPMQGQSPYVINTGLFYHNPQSETQVSMLYNVSGTRIFSVGSGEYPTIYEMPRNLVDLKVSQKIGKIDVRLGVSNLLNSGLIYREDGNRDGRINNIDTDKSILKTYSGRNVSLGLNLKF